MTETDIPMFPALKLMEKRLPPLRFGREPYWRAPVTPATKDCLTPAWNWAGITELPPNGKALTLDVNGSYLAAVGHVSIAHGNLTPTGPWEYLPVPQQVFPGYYRITVPHWAFSGTIVSPLGDSSRLTQESRIWVAHPTLVLLLELLEEGSIGDFGIIDSYTCESVTHFRAWQARLRELRKELLDGIAKEHRSTRAPEDCGCIGHQRYDAFKDGYSAALSMMLTGEKCGTRRPDWAHAVYATASAANWRKAWRYTGTGRTLLSMGNTDEITIAAEDLDGVLAMPKPPFRYDSSGVMLGAFKPKPKATRVVSHRPAALMIDEEDIL